jgi:hypothetical protein
VTKQKQQQQQQQQQQWRWQQQQQPGAGVDHNPSLQFPTDGLDMLKDNLQNAPASQPKQQQQQQQQQQPNFQQPEILQNPFLPPPPARMRAGVKRDKQGPCCDDNNEYEPKGKVCRCAGQFEKKV